MPKWANGGECLAICILFPRLESGLELYFVVGGWYWAVALPSAASYLILWVCPVFSIYDYDRPVLVLDVVLRDKMGYYRYMPGSF
jgi:hypothetical protein